MNDIFEKAHANLRKTQTQNNQTAGRRIANVSNNLDNLTFETWTKNQYDTMAILSKERSIEMDFTYEGFCNIVNSYLLDNLTKSLELFAESGFHIESSPVIDRIDLDKPFTKTNLEIISWEDKRKKWNLWFAKQKENQSKKISKRAVKCIDLTTREIVKTYPSIAEAKRFLGATGHDNRITECCEGEREQVYGFAWEYYEEQTEPDFLF